MAAISLSTDLFAQAKALLPQLREKFTSDGDFVDPVTGDPDWLDKSTAGLVGLLGKDRSVEFLRFSYDYSQTLSFVVSCGNELINARTISGYSVNAVRDLAMHRFGMGDCSELTRAALIKTASFCSPMQVVVSRDTVVTSQSVWHTFLILGVSHAEYDDFNSKTRNTQFLANAEFFKMFPRKVILDSFLNFVGETDQWKESSLGKYVAKRNMPYVLLDDTAFVPPGYPLSKSMAEAEQIYQLARQRLSSAPPLQQMKGSPDWLPFLLQHDVDAMIGCLTASFSNTASWVSKIQEGTVSLAMKGAGAEEVFKRLKALNISVSLEKYKKPTDPTYQVVLKNPNPERLCLAASLSAIFQGYTAGLQLILSYLPQRYTSMNLSWHLL
jgi:hypothetical protein